ncbi:hypothetical protein COCCADRAFT_93162, partial [Bipolaris zeicola 26-R-13]
ITSPPALPTSTPTPSFPLPSPSPSTSSRIDASTATATRKSPFKVPHYHDRLEPMHGLITHI